MIVRFSKCSELLCDTSFKLGTTIHNKVTPLVKIYYAKVSGKLPQCKEAEYFDQLSYEEKLKIKAYKRWEDQYLHLFGKLLLKIALLDFGYSNKILDEIKRSVNNRPFIDSEIDFNISHSGSYVICAISKNSKVGIDIEEIKILSDLNEYIGCFSVSEWDHIAKSNIQLNSFYKMWTRKESLLKAVGIGLLENLDKINVLSDIIYYESNYWHLMNIGIDLNYCCTLTTDLIVKEIKYISIDFYSLRMIN